MRREGVKPKPSEDPGAGSLDPGLRRWAESFGKHLIYPQTPAVVDTGVLEGLVAGPPAGLWDSSDTLTGLMFKP